MPPNNETEHRTPQRARDKEGYRNASRE